MPAARDWKLVFTCPACGHDGEVDAANLAAQMRCPHCRTSVVIEKDGMRPAPKRPPKRPPSKRPRKPTHRAAPENSMLAGGLAWCGLILALFAFLILTISSAIWPPAADDDRALRSSAMSFQSAWLDADLDAAQRFVQSGDRAQLQRWSAPRRAALNAGFGNDAGGRVTEVEVVQLQADRAVVRVAFQVRGRKQQVFQDWMLVDGAWRLILGQVASD